MHDPLRRFARAITVLCTALVLVIPSLPAGAHGGDDDHEVEVAGLELKAAPAIVKAGHPVLIKAKFETDDDADEDDDDSDELEDGDADDESDDADESDDDADDADPTVETTRGDDADEDADDADEDDADEDADEDQDDADEDDSDEDCDDEADESDDDADDDDDSQDDESGDAGVETLRRDDRCHFAVAFTVDFGDGSAPQAMTARGHHDDDKAKAHAQHAYAEEGDYQVTVTATPEGGTSVTAKVTVQVGPGGARLSGRDRFETGTDLSEEGFPGDGSASAVILARADGFADALSSATLAALEDAPVLLTSTDQLPESVLAEIQRVLEEGGKVYVLGGPSAISEGVVTTLEGLGYVVVRIAGTDRIETALAVAQALVDAGEEIDEVVLANAGNFPDALSGAARAADRGAPVLLTPATVLDPRVREFLAGLGDDVKVLVAGGPSVISDAVIAELEALGLEVERRSGKDRFATSAVIAAEEFPDATSVVIATGKTFPDALSGAAYAGRIKAPVLLVGDTLPEEVRDYLEAGAGRITLVYVIGGPNAVSPALMAEVESILGL